MKMTLDIPLVRECIVNECIYNNDNLCRARAITIGDDDIPGCDTVFCGIEHVDEYHAQAGVGACKVSNCSFNYEMECTADSITVGFMSENSACHDAMCMTYTLR